MKYIFALDGSEPLKASDVGGKGESLNALACMGVTLPKTFAIHTSAFKTFIEENNLGKHISSALKHIEEKSSEEIAEISVRLQAFIHAASIPEEITIEILEAYRVLDADYIAVRSSAPSEDGQSSAWAGQLETFLNTPEDRVIERVISCWASLYSPRAIHYALRTGSVTDKRVSVLLQEMIQSDVSGTAFSVHPVSEDTNEIIIEAGQGLGEAFVSGQIQPSSFVVSKESRKIISRIISAQRRKLVRMSGGGNVWVNVHMDLTHYLSDELLLSLADSVTNIEASYGYPVDIEWASKDSKIFILQARPITSLAASVKKNRKK